MHVHPRALGPNGAFGGLTTADALDIGAHITTLAPNDNGVIAECELGSWSWRRAMSDARPPTAGFEMPPNQLAVWN